MREGITRMAFPVERYDANTKSHPHFQCDRCGGVYDMDLPYRAELDEEALAPQRAPGHKT